MSEKFSAQDLKKILTENPGEIPDSEVQKIFDSMDATEEEALSQLWPECLEQFSAEDNFRLFEAMARFVRKEAEALSAAVASQQPRMMIVVVRRRSPEGDLPRNMND